MEEDNIVLSIEGHNLIFTKFGLANKIGDTIEINKKLLDEPQLYRKVIEHELKHVRKEKRVDWNEPFDPKLILFMCKNPSTWTHLAPVWIRGRKIIYSKTMMALWAFFFGIIILEVMIIQWMLQQA